MRYYRLDLTNSKTGKSVYASSMGGKPITSLMDDGRVNPAALNIEFDIPVTDFTPGGDNKQAFMRVWGLGLKDLSAAFDLVPNPFITKPIVRAQFSAGMSKGLPLANPAQKGLIFSGNILQAWGNWIGTDQTLDFVFSPIWGTATNDDAHSPDSFPFFWQKGTPLATAIAETLAVAVPTQKQAISISDKLVTGHDVPGTYRSLTEFTGFINEMSRSVMGGNTTYPGVRITSDGSTIWVYDIITPSKEAAKPIKIAFQDMIGQPTWIQQNQIMVKLVLRSDIRISGKITIPEKSQQTEGAESHKVIREQNKSTFNGEFTVNSVEHYGNFRQPDAMSWNTTVTATRDTK